MLKTGAQAPWSASISRSPAFKDVKVQAQGKPLTGLFGALSAGLNYQDFTLVGVTVSPPAPPFNRPKISGQVKNTGTKPATLIRMIAAVYDAGGKVDLVDASSPSLSELAPGQESPFEFTFLLGGKEIKAITKYEIFVEGLPKG